MRNYIKILPKMLFKTLLIILFFLLLSKHAKSQKQQQLNNLTTVTHVDANGYVYDWQRSNPGCYGCGSFYVKIERDIYPDETGMYNFYVKFYSNSFYANGQKSHTYIPSIWVYFSNGFDDYLQLEPFWLLVFDTGVGATLKSQNKYQIIKLVWSNPTVY